MIYPIPRRWTVGRKTSGPRRSERGPNEKSNCDVKIEGDTAQGLVVKAKKAPSAPSLDE